MSRPAFEALGFDPAPGDVHRLEEAARTMRDTVSALTEVDGVVTGEREGDWVGKAAEAFHSMVGEELAPRVTQALQSFDGASRALTDWVGQLDDFQRRADALEVRARDAQADASAAQGALDGMPEIDEEADDVADQRTDLRAAEGRVTDANAALAAVVRDGEALREEVVAASGDTADRMDASAGSAPDEPGLLDRIGNALADFAMGALDFIDTLLDAIGELLPYILFVLAVVSIFVPGLNVLIMTLAVTAILIDTKQAIQGRGSWGDVIIGVAGLGIGAALGHFAKGFMAIRGNAFQIRLNSPGVALAGGGTVPGTATAVVRFSPTAFNIGTLGWVGTKFTDLQLSLPPALQPGGDDD